MAKTNEKKVWKLYGKCFYTGRQVVRVSRGTLNSAKAMAKRLNDGEYTITRIVANDGEAYTKQAFCNWEKVWR